MIKCVRCCFAISIVGLALFVLGCGSGQQIDHPNSDGQKMSSFLVAQIEAVDSLSEREQSFVRSVEAKRPEWAKRQHSAYFVKSGDAQHPIVYVAIADPSIRTGSHVRVDTAWVYSRQVVAFPAKQSIDIYVVDKLKPSK